MLEINMCATAELRFVFSKENRLNNCEKVVVANIYNECSQSS